MDILKVKALFPNAKEGLIETLKVELDKQDWSDENKCHFIAQCGHESGGFRVLSENLNYSADALNKLFKKYFAYAGRNPNDYARRPEKIANIIYANRMGNGDIQSGDGWRYRGRGILQITGKYNYTEVLNALGQTDPAYLETAEGAVKSAILFWTKNVLYKENDIRTITRRVNGGMNGFDERVKLFEKIRGILL